jgi:hypothetical protein
MKKKNKTGNKICAINAPVRNALTTNKINIQIMMGTNLTQD